MPVGICDVTKNIIRLFVRCSAYVGYVLVLRSVFASGCLVFGGERVVVVIQLGSGSS